jgi:hypothetical protein
MFRRHDAGQANNAATAYELPSLTLFQAASYLLEMSIDPDYCFVACARAGFESRPASLPMPPVVVVANDRHFVIDQTQQ